MTSRRPLTPDDSRHGSRTGYSHGCRCAPCKLAQSTSTRAAYARKKAGLPPLARATSPVPEHGTVARFKSKKAWSCRCDYCLAAGRVAKRIVRNNTAKEEREALLAAITEAARTGAPLPPEAGNKNERAPAPESTTPEARAMRAARLRAALAAEGDPFRLALLSVAEYTEDDLRAVRYARIAQALAE